jgi:DNA-binding CsgD family transcriptional regulator
MATQESETNDNNTPIHFTSREREVLYYLAQGGSNPEIAMTLGIDERTVRQHLENIRKKVGLCGGRKLQAWAWQNGYGHQNGLLRKISQNIGGSADRQKRKPVIRWRLKEQSCS